MKQEGGYCRLCFCKFNEYLPKHFRQHLTLGAFVIYPLYIFILTSHVKLQQEPLYNVYTLGRFIRVEDEGGGGIEEIQVGKSGEMGGMDSRFLSSLLNIFSSTNKMFEMS